MNTNTKLIQFALIICALSLNACGASIAHTVSPEEMADAKKEQQMDEWAEREAENERWRAAKAKQDADEERQAAAELAAAPKAEPALLGMMGSDERCESYTPTCDSDHCVIVISDGKATRITQASNENYYNGSSLNLGTFPENYVVIVDLKDGNPDNMLVANFPSSSPLLCKGITLPNGTSFSALEVKKAKAGEFLVSNGFRQTADVLAEREARQNFFQCEQRNASIEAGGTRVDCKNPKALERWAAGN